MTKIDQFESVFKAAVKEVYSYRRIEFLRVLVVTDLEPLAIGPLVAQVRDFLSCIDSNETDWRSLSGAEFDSVQSLLDRVAAEGPDLIVTWRHLHSNAWQWGHSLGEYLDVLTQSTTCPVVVLPHPDANHALPHSMTDTDRVMAITDHLVGDERLVNYSLALTDQAGTCWLTHVEGERQFARYTEAISKIPSLDTKEATFALLEQLLKEPRDYIDSCRNAIAEVELNVQVEDIVTLGNRVSEYRRLVEEHEVDLLVMNTMDGDQLAMHGQAYPLAVELRSIPLLLL